MSMLGSAVAGIAAFLGGIAGLVLIYLGFLVGGPWAALPFLVLAFFVFCAWAGHKERHRVIPPTQHDLAMAALRRSRPLAIDAAPRTSVRGPRITTLRHVLPLVDEPANPLDSIAITDEDEDYDESWDSLR